jgi:septal ring factor EnvC (AmiA/AmiB activator)
MAMALAGVLAFGVACSDDDGDNDLGPLETPSVPENVLPTPPASGVEDDRDAFVDDVNNQIDKMEERIADIEAESDTMTGDAKAQADRQIEELKTEVKELRNSLTEFEGADDGRAQEIKDDIENTLNEAQTEIESLADQLGI